MYSQNIQMGIPGLFAWLRNKCSFILKKVPPHRNVPEDLKEQIDNLCLDMNGIFHEACQKVYRYGNYQVNKSKVHPDIEIPPQVLRKRTFNEIGKILHHLVQQVRPTKRLLLMVDGPAGCAKQTQQMMRRYRSVQDVEKKFDTNCISPGTEFMDYLSKYLDTFIRKQMTESVIWNKFEVIFSNDKAPSEGEHKILRFIRRYGTPHESYIIYGLDADLIMLSLLVQNQLSPELHPTKFYILREDTSERLQTNYTPLLTLNIASLRQYLVEELTWGLDCSRRSLINDFVFLCFFLGNDFLPHSPTIDLIDGGIELLFNSYSNACMKVNSHLIVDGKIQKAVMKQILFTLSMNEKSLLEASVRKDKFADPLLQKWIVREDEKSSLRFDEYRNEYYQVKFPSKTTSEICHQYFRGMEWVYQYYTQGIPSWDWKYPFYYAPFAQEMSEALDSYVAEPFQLGKPMEPLLQLLYILPPQSKALVPSELHSIMDTFPAEAKVDLTGKKFEWQAIVLVPPKPNFYSEYTKLLPTLKDADKRRNIIGRDFLYRYDQKLQYEHKSYYGCFQCSVHVGVHK